MRDLLELLEQGPQSNGLLIVASLVVGDSLDRSVRQTAYDVLGPIDEVVRTPSGALGDEASREQLEDGLADLVASSDGLPAVRDGLARLRAQPELAWRCYACALLTDAMDDASET